jgi:Fe-S oxidoreductase
LHDAHGPLRSLLRRVGSIHELMSHGRKSKCCGDVSRYYDPKHIDADNRQGKVREFVGSGADNMITVCAGCYEHFHNKDALRVQDLIDVAFEAFRKARAEDTAGHEIPSEQWENMSPQIEGE